LFAPVRPRIRADDAAAGAHHARAEGRDRNVIRVAVDVEPDGGGN
jgi:hypothetical protein